jgi:hypothetical protein
MAQAERSLADRTPQAGRPRLVTGGSTRPAEPAPRAEGRNAPRIPASEVPSITGVRLRPFGAEATLLNLSASGVLVECVNRLRLGTAVTVVFDGAFSPAVVEGRVARSSVATVSKNGILRYHVGIAFLKHIPLDVPAPPAAAAVEELSPAAPAVAPAPASPVAPAAVNRW